MRNIHAAELQAVSVSLVMWHQVVVVENSYPEHCGVDADTQEEDADKARYLVEGNKTSRKRRHVSWVKAVLDGFSIVNYIHLCKPQ